MACVEEIAFDKGYIDAEQVLPLAKPLKSSGYGKNLVELIEYQGKILRKSSPRISTV